MANDKTAALRRVAIVLAGLPENTARRLLDTLNPDHQRAVRLAVADLADIDPLEQRRALNSFAASVRRGRSSLAGRNEAAEVVLSKVALQSTTPPPEPDSATGHRDDDRRRPLAFLRGVNENLLAERIGSEHPQTIAIILAAMVPDQAARVLPKLNVSTRSEAMRRLAKLESPPQELVEEIAEELKRKLIDSGVDFAGGGPAGDASFQTTAGQAALKAIMSHMNNAAGDRGESSAGEADSAGERRFNAERTSPRRPADEYRTDHAHDTRRFDADEEIAEATRRTLASFPRHTPEPADAEEPSASPAETHRFLLSLSVEQLRQALASVPTRQSLLAMCGLPKPTCDRVLATLPRRQARDIRRQVLELDEMELREIDQAKSAVARTAGFARRGSTSFGRTSPDHRDTRTAVAA